MIAAEPLAEDNPSTDGARVRPFSRVTTLLANRRGVARQVLEMIAFRLIALTAGVVGSIWAARCLGAENLGISGMIVTTVTQLALLVDLNQNASFVRCFKQCSSDEERSDLISTVFSSRLLICVALMFLLLPVLTFVHVPSTWLPGILAAFPLLLVSCNQASWVLQGQDNVPVNYRAGALQAIIVAGLYLLFFRPGMRPGSDVTVQAIGVGAAFLFTWAACLGRSIKIKFHPARFRYFWPLLKEGRWLILSGLVVYVYASLELPLLGYLNSLRELGQYRSAVNLVNAAQSFLSIIPLLLYPRLIEWNRLGAGHLWRRQRALALVCVAFILPLVALIFFGAPIFYHLAYGPEFSRAAYPFAILLTSKLIVVLTGIFGWGMLAQKRDRTFTLITILAAAFSLTSNLFFIPRFGMWAAATVNLLSEIGVCVVVIACCLHRSKGGTSTASA